jgi:deglycase
VDPADYVALVIPGGSAPEYIRNDANAQRYPVLAPDVASAGAEFVDSGAVVDGQMVSARASEQRVQAFVLTRGPAPPH